ncbi:MAG: amidohydrolase family protein [Acidimicrobiales bacterium]
MPSRVLDFPVFDADNHMYETRDALTRHLPKQYKGAIDYVEVRGRTKIVVRGHISNYIPNPTFDVVAAPGAQEEYFRSGNPEGKSYRELIGDPIRCPDAFRAPEPRMELMDELGVDRALMFPTLASLVEERMKDDPELIHAVIHALNQWMLEEWTFNYKDRIYPTPVITLPIVEKALEEVEWVIENGAKAILVRPAPVPGMRGTRSLGLPEFDPVWERIAQAGLLVGMHASDSGYSDLVNQWEPTPEMLPFQPSAFKFIVQGKRAIEDTMAALVCHGALTRHPTLKVACVENGANWVPHLFDALADAYKKVPQDFEEDPIEVFRRNVWVNPFWEDDMQGLVDQLGADHILFGSDFPHPEGLANPVSYVDELSDLKPDEVEAIMGGNLAHLIDG